MKTRILVSLFLLALLSGCKQGIFSKKAYPEFELSSLSGKTLEITKIKNRIEIKNQTKPLLFLFIDPSCESCFAGIEHIKRLADSYKNQIDFIPILTNNDSSQKTRSSEALTLNQIHGLDFDFYTSEDNRFLESFERQTDTNFLVLYDDKLRLIQTYEGVVPEEMIEFDINKILEKMEEKNVSKPEKHP